MPTEILIFGAGGHAKVVIEAFRLSDPNGQLVLADGDPAKVGERVLGSIPIVSPRNWQDFPEFFHVAIGNNKFRKNIGDEIRKKGKKLLSIEHPDSSISISAVISPGCFIAAKAVVAAESSLDQGCIINHGAIVDHDCSIGPYTHVAPNATLGGGVTVGASCLVGAGATVLPYVKIGNGVVIGAGAVINSDVPDNQIVVGIPGRQVQ